VLRTVKILQSRVLRSRYGVNGLALIVYNPFHRLLLTGIDRHRVHLRFTDACKYGVNESNLLNQTGLSPFDAWLKSIGRSASTGWRWRQRGWLRVVNIAGRNYVAAEEVDRFLERAKSGEFASNTHPSLK
jgi:hypothetical protein